MKVIYTKHFPRKGYVAINIFGFIFARKEYAPISERTLNHESIHTAQMKELIYLFFYLWYGVEWFIRLIQFRNSHKAYRNISFEREAYANDRDLDYCEKRKYLEHIKYLRANIIKN